MAKKDDEEVTVGRMAASTEPVQAEDQKGKDLPFPGYDNATVGDIMVVAVNGDDRTRDRILRYERSHRERDSIIQPLVNWNS